MADSTALRDTGTVVGSLIAVLSLLYKVKKDHGINAQRSRQLDIAKTRLIIWETRSKIEETILSGEPLELARRHARNAIQEIWQQTNDNLDILADWNSKPLPVVGLPWWRRTLLLYKPVGRPKFLAFCNRLFYWFSLFVAGRIISKVLWNALIYLGEEQAVRFIDWEWISKSTEGRHAEAQLAVVLCVYIYNAYFFSWLVRRERPARRLKELERL